MAEMHDDLAEEVRRSFNAQYETVEVGLLGAGTYGEVFKSTQRSTGLVVAVKKMKLDAEDEGVPSTAIREIALLKELSHENVVKLLDVFCSTKKLLLVFEFVDNDLKKYMRSLGRQLSPNLIKSFSHQLCLGTEFCHARRIIHRDLKPQNLLVDSRQRLKIADFGLARAFSVPMPKYTHEVVTVWYRPPEILLGSELYSVPVDLWSVGCIIGEMATGQPLFAGDSEIDTIFKVFQKLGTPTVAEWPGLARLPDFKPTFPQWSHKGWENIRNTKAQVGSDGIDLLAQLLAFDPARRLSARGALRHRYFAGLEPPRARRADGQAAAGGAPEER